MEKLEIDIIRNSYAPSVKFLDEISSISALKVKDSIENFPYLIWKESGLFLITKSEGAEQKISFDFKYLWDYHQKMHYSIKKEPLAKAVGIKGSSERVVFDATCGTGQDSILLLAFGARVTAFERSPVVWALLNDAKRRALLSDSFSEVLQDRFTLNFGDIRDFNSDAPETIYIDPMYPAKKKSALPRKEMVIFRDVVGADSDSVELLKWSTNFAKERVVIKRPLKSDFVLPKPTASYKGKSTRYDMYSTIINSANRNI